VFQRLRLLQSLRRRLLLCVTASLSKPPPSLFPNPRSPSPPSRTHDTPPSPQLQQLEAQHQQRQQAATHARQDAVGAAERLEQYRQDAARFRSEAAAAEQGLGFAAARAAEARSRLTNPLRHPLVEQWRGGGGGSSGGSSGSVGKGAA
jgi:hypothetical protein